MAVQPIPDGYHTITPYIVCDDVKRLLAFVEQGLDATTEVRHDAPDGTVRHAEVRIGDSKLMMGSARDEQPAMPAMLYLYVEDCDATYAQAVEAGAETIQAPKDEFYGDRNAGLKGPCGNFWWIATHVEDVSPEEMERRAAAAMAAEDAAG